MHQLSISVGQLTKENQAKVEMDDEKAVVSFGNNHGGQIVANKNENMYIINQMIEQNNKNHSIGNYVGKVSNARNDELLMHQRMGHIGMDSLKRLRNAVERLEGVEFESGNTNNICTGCVLGKSHRHRFTKRSKEASPTQVLDMVVADLSEPIYSKYLSLIIDVASGKVFLSILNNKSETVDHIIKWNTYAQTQTGRILKRFHSDGGGEYNSNKLKQYFEKQGTVMTKTTRDTPQHNGIAEKMNCTILEMARAMLHHGEMHPSYWMDAVMTAVYLINLSVPKTSKVTRQEAWTGHKPSF